MKIIKNDLLLENKIREFNIDSMFYNDYRKHMQLLYFTKKEVIYNQGDNLNGIYILISGEIKVSFSLSNGKENILQKLKAPRIFGEIELLLDKLAPSSVEAIEDAYCIYLSLKECKELLLNDVVFLRDIAYNLSDAIYKSNSKSSINQGLSPKNRLVAYIFDIEKNQEFICDIKEVAEFTGISERHLFRILNELIQKKYIIKEKGYYKIINESALKETIEDLY